MLYNNAIRAINKPKIPVLRGQSKYMSTILCHPQFELKTQKITELFLSLGLIDPQNSCCREASNDGIK